jgi:diaminohydroxyphosphoribosylaminopyrimidine deaminase/5-amino-6-(5-phosphoribosylamino)uracil reductase
MFSADDYDFMRRALDWAERGLYTTTPNPRVGCVLVREGAVIGEGFTQPAGQNHAEIEALNDARTRGFDARGATAYVTLEPCSHFGRTPPCVTALVEARVARVIASMEDPNPLVSGKGLTQLRDAGIDVRCGLLEREAQELNIGFVSRMTRKRPWVRSKIAASLDGHSALANGRSQWITGEEARHDGHAWRARACAILTGVGTVRMDDPQLSVRYVQTPRQPPRVLVDSRLEVSLDSRLVRSAGSGSPLLVVHARHDAARERELVERGCELLCLPNPQNKVDLPALMQELGRRGINELHVETGSKLNGSLLREHCIDEMLLYVAPCLLGAGAPLIEMPQIESLDLRTNLAIHEVERVGEDLRILARLPAESAEPVESGD